MAAHRRNRATRRANRKTRRSMKRRAATRRMRGGNQEPSVAAAYKSPFVTNMVRY